MPRPAAALPWTDRDTYAAAAEACARTLYEGVRTPHRSCGIALAETFSLPSRPYQALRKGGLLGLGPCGALQAGVLVLGELLGDPDPTGPPTAVLREAVSRYRARVGAAIDLEFDSACAARTAPHGDFAGPARAAYCTGLAALAARTVAEVLWELGEPAPLGPWAPRPAEPA